MEFDITIARHGDADAIGALVEKVSREYVAPGLSEAGVRRLASIAQPSEIRKRLAEGYRFHVARAAEDVLAGIIATCDNRHLYFLYVDGLWHGQGLGARLWEAARRACEAAGHRGPYTVNASDFALGFYRRLGFVGSTRVEKDDLVFWPMTLAVAD